MTLSDEKLKELEKAIAELTEPDPDNGEPSPPLERDDNFWKVIEYARLSLSLAAVIRPFLEAREKATQGEWSTMQSHIYDTWQLIYHGDLERGKREGTRVLARVWRGDIINGNEATRAQEAANTCDFLCCAANTATEIGRIVNGRENN